MTTPDDSIMNHALVPKKPEKRYKLNKRNGPNEPDRGRNP